jgi:hypothetical protein
MQVLYFTKRFLLLFLLAGVFFSFTSVVLAKGSGPEGGLHP